MIKLCRYNQLYNQGENKVKIIFLLITKKFVVLQKSGHHIVDWRNLTSSFAVYFDDVTIEAGIYMFKAAIETPEQCVKSDQS